MWYDPLFDVIPFLNSLMYLMQGLIILTVMHILNDIALEQDEQFDEQVDTLIQNNKLLDGSSELPFDQTIE